MIFKAFQNNSLMCRPHQSLAKAQSIGVCREGEEVPGIGVGVGGGVIRKEGRGKRGRVGNPKATTLYAQI